MWCGQKTSAVNTVSTAESEPEKLALKLGTCFGGGSRKGEMCGAVAGALMVIGLLYGGVLVIIYLIGLLYLLLNEIIGTKKFMNKFKKLNGIVITEIKDIVKTFRTLFEIA